MRSKAWLGSAAKGFGAVAGVSAASNRAAAVQASEVTAKLGFMECYLAGSTSTSPTSMFCPPVVW